MSQAAADLDTIATDWQLALDHAALALDANGRTFRPDELHARRRALAAERAETSQDLARLARDVGSRQVPWLSPTPLHARALGLPDDVLACVFDLDGVLTNSAALHAAAWAEVLDGLLLRLAQSLEWHFIPFDRVADYGAYLDGRPRIEGLRMFLRSRGIRLPEEAEHELARRKSDALARGLRHGVNALPGARRYLEAVGRAGIGRAVVSSSTRTLPMLELADLAPLVEARVDAEQIAAGELRSRPAPDLLLRACELLAVQPQRAATFAHTPDGIAAGRAAGLLVIGVAADAAERERLHGHGAGTVVASLADLLDRRLLEAA